MDDEEMMPEDEILAKKARIATEKRRISGLFKDLDAKRKKAVQPLIENAAFMAATLQGLQDKINKTGAVSKYKNGANQYGTKKSPEVEIYNTMIKNYAYVIKQLTDMLPANAPPPAEDDALMKFAKQR